MFLFIILNAMNMHFEVYTPAVGEVGCFKLLVEGFIFLGNSFNKKCRQFLALKQGGKIGYSSEKGEERLKEKMPLSLVFFLWQWI